MAIDSSLPLTPSQQFTKDHAHLSAKQYTPLRLAFSEQQSAQQLASGNADYTFDVSFEGQLFKMAAQQLGPLKEAGPEAPQFKLITEDTLSSDLKNYLAHLEDPSAAETRADATQADATNKTYDFTNMSRQEIADAGKELFQAGEITLDELFRFDHPDGKLGIDANGNRIALNPDDKINFISETQQAITALEETGEATRPKSAYKMMLALLDKLNTLQTPEA